MMICAQFVILSMPVLYFYLYNIFALYVVFVRLIHRAAPSHRIASIVRSATMHVFFMSLFQIRDIASRSPLAPNRFNRSICRVYSRHFMSLFQIRDIASRRHQSKSLQSFDLRHFMSLFQIRDIASRRLLAPNRFNRSIFGVYVRLFMSSAAMQLGENTVASAYGIG